MTMLRELPQLAKAFRPQSAFGGGMYELLPFRFMPLDSTRYVLTNLAGEYILLSRPDLVQFVGHKLSEESPVLLELMSKHFAYSKSSSVAAEALAAKYRTKQALLPRFTALHIFVVSLRCDHSCPYCQVSRVSEDRKAFDMSEQTANWAIDLMFRSPSRTLKVEFQGGESLLNFPLIRYIVQESRRRNDGRDIQFVIATNLSPITREILEYCRENQVHISTSLDGPTDLHNANRPRPGGDSHARAVAGIELAREILGPSGVSALMTTTVRSLNQPEAIIDEYLRTGFRSVFLRPISPFGFAVRSHNKIGYETAAFLEFYKKGLDYILDLNRNGLAIREDYTALVLRRMLTPFPTGYVDLQSPSGIGTSVIVYNYNGDVYASDEGRMLAETGDKTFRLGTVQDSFEDLYLESPLLSMVHETMSEGIPGCVDCAFQPWCGTDPVYHHATQGDAVGIRPLSGFCQRNMGVFRHVVGLLENDPEAARILRSWVRI